MTKRQKIIIGVVVGIFFIGGIMNAITDNEVNETEETKEEVKEEKEEVKITEKTIKETKDIIESYDEVVDVTIEKEDNNITLYMVIERVNDAKQLGEDFIRSFASNASIHGEGEIEGPDGESLGEIWQYYNGDIYIGYDTEPFLHGVIQENRDNIRWFDL